MKRDNNEDSLELMDDKDRDFIISLMFPDNDDPDFDDDTDGYGSLMGYN